MDGQHVTLTAPPLGAPAARPWLTFDVERRIETGLPVTDPRKPYLPAPPGICLMVSADLWTRTTATQLDFGTKGPRLSFHVRPPNSGSYKVWVQFQRAGTVTTVPFVVTAK